MSTDTTIPPASPVIPAQFSRGSFYREARLYLAGTVLVDDVEQHLERYHKRIGSVGPLLFDFTDAEYIDIAALINCIAQALHRTEQGRRTFFAYPSKKSVRDFLHVWRFPEAVQEATKFPFAHFLVSEDHHYLDEDPITFTGSGDGINALEYDPDWNGQTESRRNFFEFTTFVNEDRQAIRPEGQFRYAPRKISRRWAEPSVIEVLERHLGGDSPKEEIARVIVYEAVSNSVRHPSARVIQVVSKFDRGLTPISEQGPQQDHAKATVLEPFGALRICIWDDGDPISGTLSSALDEGRPIQAFRLPSFMCDRIFVEMRDQEANSKSQRIVDQSDELTPATATEELLLLASLFPGVSRTVAKIVPKVEPFDERSNELNRLQDYLSSAPGMGLYALTRTVLDQFQGSLLLRTGRHRLSIEMAHDTYRSQYQVRYKSKITKYPDKCPPFRGNLLIMKLPVQPRLPR